MQIARWNPILAKSSSSQNRPQSHFPLVFHSQVTLCMFYIKKVALQLKARKHCKNAVKTPFFGASSPSKNHPWNAFFSPDHKKRKGRYVCPFLMLMFFSPGHKHLGKLYRQVPKTSCTWRFSCAFLSCPPPLTQVDGGNASYLYASPLYHMRLSLS